MKNILLPDLPMAIGYIGVLTLWKFVMLICVLSVCMLYTKKKDRKKEKKNDADLHLLTWNMEKYAGPVTEVYSIHVKL